MSDFEPGRASGRLDRAGIRAILGIVASTAAVGIGLRTVQLQADNYAVAAKLDGLQREAEWNERQVTALRARVDRFEFDALAKENRAGPEDSTETQQR